jgi:hypothetical protein
LLLKSDKSERISLATYRRVFKGGQAAMEVFVGRVEREIGGVLAHKADKYILGLYDRSQTVKHLYTVGAVRGKNEVAHKHAALKNIGLVG